MLRIFYVLYVFYIVLHIRKECFFAQFYFAQPTSLVLLHNTISVKSQRWFFNNIRAPSASEFCIPFIIFAGRTNATPINRNFFGEAINQNLVQRVERGWGKGPYHNIVCRRQETMKFFIPSKIARPPRLRGNKFCFFATSPRNSEPTSCRRT